MSLAANPEGSLPPVVAVMRAWLARRLSDAAIDWFGDALAQVRGADDLRPLMLAFSLAPRRVGREPVHLTPAEVEVATAARPGWQPRGLRTDTVARLVLLLALPPQRLLPALERLFAAADLNETIALYRGLPLYPDPTALRARAEEGLRSNIKPVFEAVALNNPYPAEQLGDNAWNHMVLKAIFIGSRLADIVGLDGRCTPTLARMLCDYARERRAAGRPVSPELWRCVGPCGDGEAVALLARVLAAGDPREQAAAALALAASPRAEAARCLAEFPDVRLWIERGIATWERIADAGSWSSPSTPAEAPHG
jgi:hypothetical protein